MREKINKVKAKLSNVDEEIREAQNGIDNYLNLNANLTGYSIKGLTQIKLILERAKMFNNFARWDLVEEVYETIRRRERKQRARRMK